jgi:hypothetical protein
MNIYGERIPQTASRHAYATRLPLSLVRNAGEVHDRTKDHATRFGVCGRSTVSGGNDNKEELARVKGNIKTN